MINRYKRGITIVAAAVAIAVFSVVAAAGISLAVKSVKAERNNLINLEVSVHAENALACYRAVGGVGLLSALRVTDDNYPETETNNVIKLTKPDYEITIEYGESYMVFTAKKGDKTILEYTYDLREAGNG